MDIKDAVPGAKVVPIKMSIYPFSWDRVMEDLPNDPTVRFYKENKYFVVKSREGNRVNVHNPNQRLVWDFYADDLELFGIQKKIEVDE